MHTPVTSIRLLSANMRADLFGPRRLMRYIGMPGRAATAAGLTDDMIGPFGKPWACLDDPRGWQVAYREHLWSLIRSDADFALAVRDLHGKTLVCWCKGKNGNADQPCHGDILAAAVEWLFHGIEAVR